MRAYEVFQGKCKIAFTFYTIYSFLPKKKRIDPLQCLVNDACVRLILFSSTVFHSKLDYKKINK